MSSDEHDSDPTLLQTESADLLCMVPDRGNGSRYLLFGGRQLPSLQHAVFGLFFTAETTQKEAEALAELINKHCPAMFGMFYDRGLKYYDIGENGLKVLDSSSQDR